MRNLEDVIPLPVWVHPNGATSRGFTHAFGDPKCINPIHIGWSKNDGLLFGRALEADADGAPMLGRAGPSFMVLVSFFKGVLQNIIYLL